MDEPPPSTSTTASIFKRSTLRKRKPVHTNNKNRRRIILSQTPLPKISKAMVPAPPQSSSHSLLVSEAIALATSKGLRSGYIEFLRSNTDESIKRSFDEVKKELTNRQSFLKSATSVVRYLQAARILYNRLEWRERRKYEYAARDRARAEHSVELRRKGVDDDMPLFINESQSGEKLETISKNACHMPLSEHLLKDRRSLEDFRRYEACKSRKIHCPLCPIGSDRLTNAVHYQGHMMEHHSCAYFFACHFCGLVFPSLEALKIHNGCEEFATALVQRISSSGEVEFHMNFCTLVMVCTDCGSQMLIRASYIGESSISHWNDIVNFHMHHNTEKVVPLIIFSQEDFTVKMRLRVQAMTPVIKGVQVVCPYCKKCDFDSVEALESHFLSHEECVKKHCPECSMHFTQEAFYREHLLSHLGTKACYLALHLSRICTFITGGVPSCGPNLAAAGGLIYGGVSSAAFNSKIPLQYATAWESLTVRKKSNRRGRKRRAGPAYKKDPDEIEDDTLPADETAIKLRKLLGDSFDCENVLRLNGFFYTALHSKDETDESSKLYNSLDEEIECLVEDRLPEAGTKLADDMSRRFSRNCRLAGGKTLSKKHNPSHKGLFSKILMCRRCHCICVGLKAVYAHLSRCCPELRCDESSSTPFDLDNGLLVFCIYSGNGMPNTRITCWECSSSVCSVLGLRVHMIVDHGVFLKVEDEPADDQGLVDDRPAFFSTTSRLINKTIGLTENGSLPVNLEERRKEALMAKMKNHNVVTSSPSQLQPSSNSPASAASSHISKVETIKAVASSAPRVSTPPMVILYEETPPSVQILQHVGPRSPHSTEIVDRQNQLSPSHTTNGFTELTIEELEVGQTLSGANFTRSADKVGVSVADGVQVYEVSGCSSDHGDLEENEPISSFSQPESTFSTNNGSQEYGDPCDETTTANAPQVEEDAKGTPECEFCGLTLRSNAGLRKHYKLHSEISSVCYLCDPTHFCLDTTQDFLNHICTMHTTPPNLPKEDGLDYAVCSFCDFQVRKSRIVPHLISDCYMAPCFFCGDKLARKNDRMSHRRTHREIYDRFMCECRRGFSHFTNFMEHQCRTKTLSVVSCTGCDVKFTASLSNGRSKVLNDTVEHFMKEHTRDHHCLLCKTEPLEALREHVLTHLTESSEVCTPERALLTCKNVNMFLDTTEENLYNIELQKSTKERKRSKKAAGSTSDQDMNEIVDASDVDSAPSLTLEEFTSEEDILHTDIIEESQTDDCHPIESGSSRDGNSPSVFEKQRQVLAGLLDDLGPPPSVIIIENEAAVIREEREEPPSVVPRSSVADDGEDDILVIDEMGEQTTLSALQSPPPSLSISTPVVHTVNKGDDDCMMLNVVELPTGSISHTVASTREKKYKCSMCSETFLRESTCRHHEQTSHRNDIVSDTCDEVYGVPLGVDCFMYLCQQCTVAFEDPQRARKHLAQHMVKGPAFPCEKCSSICLTDSNLREHHKKHSEGKLSYRCLKCNPNKVYYSESAVYYHLYMEHSVPLIAFCKNCLVGSANLDRIFTHTLTRECSGGCKEIPRPSPQTLLRSLGFAIASELYFQPNDETVYRQAVSMKVARFAEPTFCSHRSFITFGDSFTTCPEDPSRCSALVNQNRWHSYLCATNRENPGEMPSTMPEGIFVKNVYAENMIDMLQSRFRINEHNRGISLSYTGSPSRSSGNVPPILTPVNQSASSDQLRHTVTLSTCEIANRRRAGIAGPSVPQVPATPMLIPSQQGYVNQGGDVSALRQTLNSAPVPHAQSQAACIFCRRRNEPMICEPQNRAYEAVNSLCIKFREVHPVAAQTLFSSLNSFIRETVNRRHGRALFCFCRWHYSPQCFDSSGQHITNLPPTQLNSALLLNNYHKGLFYPDPACVTILTTVAVPPPQCRPIMPALTNAVTPTQSVVQRCVVCSIVVPKGNCRATNFCVDYMVTVPLLPPTLKEQWATHICRSLSGSLAQEVLNAFRVSLPPRLCIRHFNPRSLMISPSGVITKNPSSISELPVLDFPLYAMLNNDFSQALSKLLDGMEKGQNFNTIAMMLKIVQELVKCNDEKCARPLNSCNDVLFHRFHDLQHKFVCMECFSIADVIRTEQEMIEHFVSKHSQRSPSDTSIPVVYSLHCPLRNCNAALPSVQTLRKHINHAHSGQFSFSSDNCATRFFNSAKMIFHNGVHEKHSCDVTCCYLCGVADPWQREVGGVKISHELVHAMRRFIACKTCMAPMGQDPTGVMLIDHFMRQHMLDQPKRVRHCKVCRQNVVEPGIAEHILEQHRLIAFRARYAPQSNMVSIMNGSEFCVYLGIPPEIYKPNPLAESSELG